MQRRSAVDASARAATTPPPQRREVDALVQALGEFAVFVAQTRRAHKKKRRANGGGSAATASSSSLPSSSSSSSSLSIAAAAAATPPHSVVAAAAADEKRAVLEWLRALSPAECASLSVISDVGFVKTLLMMAMTSKQRRATGGVLLGSHIDEFQLLPLASKPLAAGDAKSWLKSDSAGSPPAATATASPREFVRRPRIRTMDGDVLGAFHSRAYSDCCEALLPFVRILNARQSCDSLALSLALFDASMQHSSRALARVPGAATASRRNGQFLCVMEHIADGQFLRQCPSDAALRSRVWGETPWLASQGYYSLQALIVNEIELNIWRHWIERKRLASALSYRVPLGGLSAKQLLADEWMRASAAQQREILMRLGAATASHCRSLSSSHASGARASLAGLTAVLAALHDCAHEETASAVPVDRCFSCSFVETLASPQASVLKLILAEQLQAQCSLLLSERLALEDERASAQQTLLRATGADACKPSNHTQRRRANRKKLLKKRRHDAEERVAQQQLLKTVLDELRAHVRKRRDAAKRAVSEILSDIVTSAAAAAKPKAPKPQHVGASGQTVVSLLEASSASAVASKKKAKKKRKKSSSSAKKSESDLKRSGNSAASDKRAPSSPHASAPLQRAPLKSATTLLLEPSELEPVDLDEKENVAVASAQHLDDSSSGGSPDARPLLSFLDKSYASPLSLPTFGPQPLYSSSSSPSSPPFFLSLAPRALTSGRDRSRVRRGDLVAGDDRTSTESAASSNNSSSHDSSSSHSRQPKASTFEWYLPSLFSSEASNHTNSTTSSLDWDFHNWQLKNDSSSSSTTASATTAVAAMAKPSKTSGIHGSSAARAGLRSSSHSTAVAATGAPAPAPGVEESLASPSKTYSLESFSNLLRVDAPRSHVTNVHDATERDHDSVAAAAADACETPDESAVGAVQSDFLYRQGGFFDRQRALKRRRRPLPFDYDVDSDGDRDGGEADHGDGDDDDVWGEYPHRCCKCLCHEANSDANATCACTSSALAPQDSDDASPVTQSERSSETAAMLERLTALEAALEAKTQALDEIALTLPKEVASLQQTVASLSAQLVGIESALRDLTLARDLESSSSSCNRSPAPRSSDRERSGSVHSTLSESSPLPHPPQAAVAPSDSQQQQQPPPPPPPPHEIASSEYMYESEMVAPMDASPPSALGPFVSVPMSVLPPRTKLHWDMCEFISQLQTDSNARLPAQMAALRLCTATVQSLWPRAQVRPYGSFVSRLVLPSSDIDLVICLPKVRRDAPADAAGVLEGRNAIKETWQQNLARKLRLEPWVVPDSVKTIPLAAIPIITLVTTAPYNVRLDISFEGPGHNGLATNDVVLSLLHEFPPLAPIMLVLKSFAIERGFAMAYSGGLSSYSLLLMVARYLQEHSDSVSSGFEDVGAPVQHSAQACADFGMMLMGFLDFYGNRFDPRTTGISVASRCFLSRESTLLSGSAKDHHQYAADDAVLDDRSAAHHHHNTGHWQLPQQSLAVQDSNLLSSPGSRRYGNRSSMDWPQNTHMVDLAHDPHKFDPVFIEDPLHPSNNVGRNLFRIMQIRRAFAAAYSTLLAASVQPATFSENRTSKITGVALHPDNMLRAILGANAPVKAKSDAAASSSGTGSTAATGVDSASGSGSGSGSVGFPYPNYTHAGVPGTAHYFASAGGASSSSSSSGTTDATSAPPYPFYAHYPHPPPSHYLQAQQQRAHAMAAAASTSSSAVVRSDSVSSGSTSSYRRYSESGSERASLTARSDVAAVATTASASGDRATERRRDRLASPRLATHSVSKSTMTATIATAAAADSDGIKTRKGPARSLSFADVVVGGNTYSASTMEYHRKEPSSPLARPLRYWRDDSAIEDSMSEKWEAAKRA